MTAYAQISGTNRTVNSIYCQTSGTNRAVQTGYCQYSGSNRVFFQNKINASDVSKVWLVPYDLRYGTVSSSTLNFTTTNYKYINTSSDFSIGSTYGAISYGSVSGRTGNGFIVTTPSSYPYGVVIDFEIYLYTKNYQAYEVTAALQKGLINSFTANFDVAMDYTSSSNLCLWYHVNGRQCIPTYSNGSWYSKSISFSSSYGSFSDLGAGSTGSGGTSIKNFMIFTNMIVNGTSLGVPDFNYPGYFTAVM